MSFTKVIPFIAIFVAVTALLLGKLDALAKLNERASIELQNQIAKTDSLKTVVGGWERRALQYTDLVDSLKGTNSDLAGVIKRKDQEVLSLTETNIKLNDIIFNSNNAEAISDTVLIDTTGNERHRVNFEFKHGLAKMTGWTLTNPPDASMLFEWIRPIELTTVITRGQSGAWHGYVTSPDSMVVPTKLDIKVDDSIFDPANRAWYRRFIGGAGSTGASVFGTISYEHNNNFYGLLYENRSVDGATDTGWGIMFQRRF